MVIYDILMVILSWKSSWEIKQNPHGLMPHPFTKCFYSAALSSSLSYGGQPLLWLRFGACSGERISSNIKTTSCTGREIWSARPRRTKSGRSSETILLKDLHLLLRHLATDTLTLHMPHLLETVECNHPWLLKCSPDACGPFRTLLSTGLDQSAFGYRPFLYY